MDLHEIISFKVLCATKSTTMQTLVQDEELKNILQQDFNSSKEHLKELVDLIKTSPFIGIEN